MPGPVGEFYISPRGVGIEKFRGVRPGITARHLHAHRLKFDVAAIRLDRLDMHFTDAGQFYRPKQGVSGKSPKCGEGIWPRGCYVVRVLRSRSQFRHCF
jgi:hypothetical protein